MEHIIKLNLIHLNLTLSRKIGENKYFCIAKKGEEKQIR